MCIQLKNEMSYNTDILFKYSYVVIELICCFMASLFEKRIANLELTLLDKIATLA